jgi:hypothetical protein
MYEDASCSAALRLSALGSASSIFHRAEIWSRDCTRLTRSCVRLKNLGWGARNLRFVGLFGRATAARCERRGGRFRVRDMSPRCQSALPSHSIPTPYSLPPGNLLSPFDSSFFATLTAPARPWSTRSQSPRWLCSASNPRRRSQMRRQPALHSIQGSGFGV